MKRACPFCAERIQAAATVCRFCGRTVEPVPGVAARDRGLLLPVLLLVLLVVLGLALLYAYRSTAPAARSLSTSEAIRIVQAGDVSHLEF